MISNPAYAVSVYLVGALLLGGAIAVVTLRNTVRAALALTFTFAMVAATYLLLSAELLFVVQLLVCAVGMSVLLLFGLLTTRRGGREPAAASPGQRLVAVLVAAVLFALLAVVLGGARWAANAWPGLESTTAELGKQLLTAYVVPFEAVALVLLVALVGAAVLGRRDPDEVRAPIPGRRGPRRRGPDREPPAS